MGGYRTQHRLWTKWSYFVNEFSTIHYFLLIVSKLCSINKTSTLVTYVTTFNPLGKLLILLVRTSLFYVGNWSLGNRQRTLFLCICVAFKWYPLILSYVNNVGGWVSCVGPLKALNEFEIYPSPMRKVVSFCNVFDINMYLIQLRSESLLKERHEWTHTWNDTQGILIPLIFRISQMIIPHGAQINEDASERENIILFSFFRDESPSNIWCFILK